MRAFVLTCFSICCPGIQLAARSTIPTDTEAPSRWTLGLSFFQAFAAGGQVSVREQVYTGTLLDFDADLGMQPWRSLTLDGEYAVKTDAALSLSADYFFFSGSATVNKAIWFNGVHMTGTDGLSPERTVHYRLQFAYEKKIHPERKVYPVLCAGLVADFLDFHVEGTMLPDTWGREQHERFARQALPYPFLGAKLFALTGTNGYLLAEISGTYIPEFKSFFDEGGPMWLQYSTLQTGVDYGRRFGDTTLQLGMHYRSLSIWQESPEDTNDVLLHATGVRLRLERTF